MQVHKTIYFPYIFLILIGFIFFSCKDENNPIPEVVKEKAIWKKNPKFTFNSTNLLTGKAFDDILILSGTSILTTYKGIDNFSHYLVPFLEYRPPIIGRNLNASPYPYPSGINDSIVYFRSNYNPVASYPYSVLPVNVKELGLGIERVNFTSFVWGDFTPMVDGKVKFLMGCFLENNQNALLLLEFEHKEGLNPIVLINKTIIPVSGTRQSISKIRFMKDNFYVYRSTFDSQELVLRVSLDGSVLDLYPQLKFTHDFFSYGEDTLCHYTQENMLSISIDNGLTWQPHSSGFPSSSLWQFSTIKDKTFMFTPFKNILNLDLGTYKYQVLDTEGLPDNLIKAVEYYNDTIYVATFGAGLYSKSYQEVLDDIKSKEEL